MRDEQRGADRPGGASTQDETTPEALNVDDVERVRKGILDEIRERPPTLAVIGVSGVGKSSTLNALFRTGLPTSATVACTKEFLAVEVELTPERGRTAGLVVPLRVVDAPGLGEDIERDAAYLEQYMQNLPLCDAVLWISAARSRAVSLDQMYLETLSEFHDNMVFGVNQIDLVEPVDWSENVNLPSPSQEDRIEEILSDRRARFESIVGRPIAIEAYSAKRGFGLQAIFTALIEAMPTERTWIYSDLKNFAYDDFVPAGLRDLIDDEVAAATGPTRSGRGGRRWGRRT